MERENILPEIITLFENHCVPGGWKFLTKDMFRMRTQNEGETMKEFVTDLNLKSQAWKYGELQDSH